MTALDILVNLGAILLGCTAIAVWWVILLRFLDRRIAAESFAEDFISEVEDVAAIEATLPDMRLSSRAVGA